MPRTTEIRRLELDAPRRAVFSLTDARRALQFVSRVAQDAADAFREAQNCRQSLETETYPQNRALLCERRDLALQRLNAAIDECNSVGADLVDIPEGVVRFAAQIEGQRVSLLWRLGEPVESAWPTLDSAAAAG